MSLGKKPLVALILSILPGLGQIYNGEVAKGLVIAGSCLLLALGAWWLPGSTGLSFILALAVVWISVIVDAYKTAKVFGKPLDWYHRVPYVVAMLLLVGPLALPLLWRSPYFSRFARWTWTFVVVGGLLLFFTIPYLVSWLFAQRPELKPLLEQYRLQP
jgi:TM2 domain-containing membrane protein YozV